MLSSKDVGGIRSVNDRRVEGWMEDWRDSRVRTGLKST